MAKGRVITGYSSPYVCTYTNNGGTVTHGTPTVLARGVDVTITPDAPSDNNDFYADNQLAETASSSKFTGGTFSMTVDGLKDAAEKLIMGLPAADTDGFMAYGDDQTAPNLTLGFVVRYMEDGKESFVPVVLTKVTFNPIDTSAATQGEEISFQTQSLSGKIMRDDSTKHVWKYVGSEADTEDDAITAMLKKMA